MIYNENIGVLKGFKDLLISYQGRENRFVVHPDSRRHGGTDAYSRKLSSEEKKLFQPVWIKGSDPLSVERKIRNEIEMGLSGVNQIRIAGSMYAHTKLYNSNIVFVSSKEEVEKLVKMFKKMTGRKFCGVAGASFGKYFEDGGLISFGKVHTPPCLGSSSKMVAMRNKKRSLLKLDIL